MCKFRKIFLPEVLQYFRLCSLEGESPTRVFYINTWEDTLIQIVNCDILNQEVTLCDKATYKFELIRGKDCLYEEV